MLLSEMAEVLAVAAAYDGRTTDMTDVEAWHAAIGDLDRDLAIAAVARHYRLSTEWVRPANVFRLAEEISRERRREARERREAEEKAAARRALDSRPLSSRGAEVRAEVAKLVAKLAISPLDSRLQR